jgi:hypothetical protein
LLMRRPLAALSGGEEDRRISSLPDTLSRSNKVC